ncbi:MAG: hypothetical protein ABR540_00855 [Acidimicrobiales bacterium]
MPEANPALGLFAPVVQSLGLPEAVPPGPDNQLYSDAGGLADLLRTGGLVDVSVHRLRWTLAVDAAAWFDAVAAGTPRTGAVLTAANPEQRAALRERYVELVTTRFGSPDGSVTLPAAALVGRGRSNPRQLGGRRPSGSFAGVRKPSPADG